MIPRSARSTGRGARLFAFPAYRRLAKGFSTLPRVAPGAFRLERFPNGELHVDVQTPVAGTRCLVLGTIAPPEENLASYLLLCHTLHVLGARTVVAVLPYLSYSRQDRNEPGKSRSAAWIGELLGASGADAIVTVDVHSPRMEAAAPMPVRSLSPAAVFASEIRRRSLLDATIVAPDEGAEPRCRDVAREAGLEGAVATFTKRRTIRGVAHTGLRGKVGRRAVIVDDMLDTGSTLLSCCAELRHQGTREVYVFVTHGLFTGRAWRRLRSLGVRRIVCTDTVPLRPSVARSVHVCSISSLLARGAWNTAALRRPREPVSQGGVSWNGM